ncbi:MAG: hypothetical protein DRI61_15055 [Chloroflexi bacterium]|nr:MAG: hypothetical protein DRI61_15055 [Chloroflexota bacterium]
MDIENGDGFVLGAAFALAEEIRREYACQNDDSSNTCDEEGDTCNEKSTPSLSFNDGRSFERHVNEVIRRGRFLTHR